MVAETGGDAAAVCRPDGARRLGRRLVELAVLCSPVKGAQLRGSKRHLSLACHASGRAGADARASEASEPEEGI